MRNISFKNVFSERNRKILFGSTKLGIVAILIGFIASICSELIADLILFGTLEKYINFDKVVLVIENLSATLFSIGLLSILFNTFQYAKFLNLVETRFNEIVNKELPPEIKNIKNQGITDIYDNLDTNILGKRLWKIRDRRVKVLKIWMPNIESICPAIIDAVNNRGCRFHVMLLDPISQGAIDARVESLKDSDSMTSNYIKEQIRLNEERIVGLLDHIDEDKYDQLILKSFTSFVSVSLFGFGDTYWVGLYLRNRLATNGMIFKFESAHKPRFGEIDRHFKTEWKEAKLNELYIKKLKSLNVSESSIEKIRKLECNG
ncbi:hypothetical protein [Flagellimonas pacifica]|uniref:Uncharacterized protein n=1 Tax=Flagellimonas pacifica TaxID=1247520 RepID=A0A285MQL9_9FLAO|nr:hypothetical protein [Allomuricauda parva]SNY99482.1 hypothetical protein SAMN06265377_1289 [Allomuricauda parva]